MGFRAAAVPAESPQTVGRSRVMDGLRVVDVDNVARALELLGMVEDDLRREAP
jgi:DNA repair protein RadA/Sms